MMILANMAIYGYFGPDPLEIGIAERLLFPQKITRFHFHRAIAHAQTMILSQDMDLFSYLAIWVLRFLSQELLEFCKS